MPLLPREEARALLYVCTTSNKCYPKYVSITHHYTSEFLDMIIDPS